MKKKVMGTIQGNSVAMRKYASEIISNATFKKIILESDLEPFYSRANKYVAVSELKNIRNNSQLLKHVYCFLSENYRTEYFYKNTIINELTTKEEFKQDTVSILNEFKIGRSIADLVFINGVDKVFEIKTELDSPERLKSQVDDYRKMFSEVYVVTHHSLQSKYSTFSDKYDIGLIVLNSKLELETVKDSPIVLSFLDVEIMAKSLRKAELLNVIQNLNSKIPDVPNTQFSDACLSLLKSHDIRDVHLFTLQELKKRKIKQFNLFNNNKTIQELKHICLSLDLDIKHYEALHNFLKSPFVPHSNN